MKGFLLDEMSLPQPPQSCGTTAVTTRYTSLRLAY